MLIFNLKLYFLLFVGRALLAPLAELQKFKLALYFFGIFTREIVVALALRAIHLAEKVL